MDHCLIVHLSTVHPARDVRIYHKECRSLARHFGKVLLLVHGSDSGDQEGVEIRPLKRYRSRLARMFLGPIGAAFQALRARGTIVHFHDPELIPVGLLLRACGRKVLYDAHEDLPRQVLTKPWIPRPLRPGASQLAAGLEGLAARVLSGIVAATPTIGSRFPSHKTALVRNFPKLEEFAGVRGEPYDAREPLFAYAGGIEEIRGAREMVAAMGLLPEYLNATLALAGEFTPREFEKTLWATPGWNRVRYLGWQTRPQIAELYSRARAGLVVLHPSPSYLPSLPVKLFEYMAAGLPVIASDFPLWRQIVQTEQCGLLVDPLNPAAIAAAMQSILSHGEASAQMGARGRRAVETKYNWEIEAQTLVDFYGRLLAPAGSALLPKRQLAN